MVQINCVDCLKTFRPYRYSVAFQRVLMYGFSDWWEFEDERIMEDRFLGQWRDPSLQRRLIVKTNTYLEDDSFCNDFIFYCQFLENKRRQSISAPFLCFDCEKYYCINCVSKHSGHFTFSKDDKYDISKWRRISVEILERLNAEGDRKLENMRREQTYLCAIVHVRCEHDKLPLYDKPSLDPIPYVVEGFVAHANAAEFSHIDLPNLENFRIEDLHIFSDNEKWLVTDKQNKCIKVFNVHNNRIMRRIKLSACPHGITKIPSTDSLQYLIAVGFPCEKQIHIMNIHNIPANVISSIKAQDTCYDLAYCNNKLIIRCMEFHEIAWRHSIHVMNLAGEIINIIDLHNSPGIKVNGKNTCYISVHSESETIYVWGACNPPCVVSLSLDGQVLHSVTFTDMVPILIHVDKKQNVYVMDYCLPLYKLSPDLGERENVIEEDVGRIPGIIAMTFHRDKFYLASNEGHIYILQHDTAYGTNKRKHGDRINRVQSAEITDSTEHLTTVIQPEKGRSRVASLQCSLL